MPSLGLGYLAAVASDAGHDVTVLNCVKERLDANGFTAYLQLSQFDVIGFQVFSYDLNVVHKLLEIVRAVQPKAVTVAGGPHPSGDPLGVLSFLGELDYAFAGEAETGFVQWLQLLPGGGDMASVPGLIYRDAAKMVRANPPRFVEDLDALPLPAWELLKPEEYPEAPHGAFTRNFPTAPIILTRGCPCLCTFCSGDTITGRKVRRRSVANIMTELVSLHARGIREVHIEDENFTFSKRYVLEFCDALEQSGLGLSWSLPSGVRIDTLDAELLDRMERAGCYSLALGIEFGVDRVMQLAKKGLTVAGIRQKMELFRGRRIKTTGFFLFGIPGETYEEMEKTLDLALQLPLDRAQFNNFMPLPGSSIWKDLEREGLLDRIDWDRMFVHDVAYCDEGINPKRIKSLQRKAYLRFYLRPRVLFSLIFEVRSPLHLKFLLKRFLDALV
jgi:radical SAM superfamily enzyme YgiQ (UPF0313 family)